MDVENVLSKLYNRETNICFFLLNIFHCSYERAETEQVRANHSCLTYGRFTYRIM